MNERAAVKVKIPERVVETIRLAERVVLLTHVHPDGDALGSTLGFADILDGLGKEVLVFFEEPVNHLYQFLPGKDRVVTDIDKVREFTAEPGGNLVVVALDSGDDRRLGRYLDELLTISPFLVIDHHRSHQDYGEYRWVDFNMSSTGEMIFELARALEAEISYSAAVNLYVAICTDTGSFRYEATSPRTHHIVAELIELGVHPDEAARNLYDNVSLARMHLLQLVLQTLKVYDEGQLAFIYVTRQMIEESGATVHDIEGFVDFPRSLGSVKVAVFIKQTDNEMVSVSLRAKGELDVAEVANALHGGGHRNAAGFRVKSPSVAEVRDLVLRELRQRLLAGR
ncbi:MAG: DHH family phosphoesterase [Desulfopila sp.]